MKTKIKELEMSLRNDPSILGRVLCEILFNIQQELEVINQKIDTLENQINTDDDSCKCTLCR